MTHRCQYGAGTEAAAAAKCGAGQAGCALKSLDGWTSQVTDADYQIIWVDLAEHETLFAGDWLDYLISRKLLTPKQMLVLVCHYSQILQLAMDYPYHNIVCLEHPWSIAIAGKSISQFFRLCSVLQPIQGLANVMRYSDALKLINYQLTKQPDAVLLQHLQRIQLHVLAETRQLPPLKPDERWLSFESWLHFRQWYHNESVDAVIAMLLKPGLQFNKYAERQDSYLLYLHLLKGDIAGAFELTSRVPAQKQTSRLLRLIHLTAVLAGQLAKTTDVWALAELIFFCVVGTNAVQDLRYWVKPLGCSRWHGVALD